MKLSDIKEPKFKIDLGDNQVKEYDPWELSEKLQALGVGTALSLPETFDAIRTAFGFPTTKQIEESTDDPKPKTLTRNQCMYVNAELAEFISKLDCSKKQQALLRS